jgi:transcriptional regulator with XRE-family HTH domain
MQSGKPAITGAQIRAARAFLRWSVHDLAARCGVSESAISRAEKVDHVPGMQDRNLDAVRTAFEIHGIEFLDSTGLRMRPLRRE